MILYDDKHNFLGMSSHTLGFLGYEDVGEFLSMHNDFANLFVNKEGYIYNFDNFNWIDFVLYSGAANKTAIITLKNGKETKVDLSIKEVHLGHELNGIKKLYSVKLISDNFHEISGVPKSSESTGGTGGFSLSGLVEKEEKVEEIAAQNNFQNLIEEPKHQEAEKSESFILNINEDTLTPKETVEHAQSEDTVTSNNQDDFKLDFMNQESQDTSSDFILKPTESEDANIDFLLKNDEEAKETTSSESDFTLSQIEQKDETQSLNSDFLLKKHDEQPTPQVELQNDTPNIDFLLKNNDEEITPIESNSTLEQIQPQNDTPNVDFLIKSHENEVEEESSKEQQTESPKVFEFNLLKEETHTDTSTLELESNLLKEAPVENFNETDISNHEIQKTKEVENSTPEDNRFKLDFLKMDMSPTAEPEVQSKETESNVLAYQETDNQAIIQQIKNDIEEIDNVNEEIVEEEQNNTEIFSLNIPSMPQVEQPLEMDTHTTENIMDESLSNFQIHENKSLASNKSFTSTLKGLFNTKKDHDQEEFPMESNNEAFSFHIKDNHHLEEQEIEDKLEIISDEDEKNINEIIPQETTKEEISFASLSALGLTPDDEFDLLSDFIMDAKESIDTIEQFIETKDFDKINYSLVKIKSSAEILNLDAIINNANNIRKHCITENSEKVIQETKALKENINTLGKQLEVTAI